ncbi:hypothetical protein EMIT0111MI5_40349 [Burkholderia sp. IT-111MI5]
MQIRAPQIEKRTRLHRMRFMWRTWTADSVVQCSMTEIDRALGRANRAAAAGLRRAIRVVAVTGRHRIGCGYAVIANPAQRRLEIVRVVRIVGAVRQVAGLLQSGQFRTHLRTRHGTFAGIRRRDDGGRHGNEEGGNQLGFHHSPRQEKRNSAVARRTPATGAVRGFVQ